MQALQIQFGGKDVFQVSKVVGMDMVSDGNDGNLAILQVTSNQKGDVAGASAKGVHALGRVSPMAHTSQEDQSPLKPH